MACPPILTGDRFLARVIDHIDCQAQTIGTFGYHSLAAPGSTAWTVMSGLLTVFIALFAIRLLFGPTPSARDLVFDVLKIGIVLTLAFSWLAFRPLAYDLTLKGPAELATALSGTSTPDTGRGFTDRLQRIDSMIVDMTVLGTGRTNGEVIDRSDPNTTFEGAALEDEESFGSARLVWLTGVIAPLGTIRLLGGILLALAPLAAGLLLFEATRGLFAGWLRGLVLALIGSVGVTMVLAVEVAVLEPWFADVFRLRGAGYAAPAAPTELLAIVTGFAFASLGVLYALVRVAFQRGWVTIPQFADLSISQLANSSQVVSSRPAITEVSRTRRIADQVERTIEREDRLRFSRTQIGSIGDGGTGPGRAAGASQAAVEPRLGTSWRGTNSGDKSRSMAVRDRIR